MNYKILEHDKARKFKRKHKNDKQLLYSIDKKYIEIIKNYPELYSVYKDDLDVEFNVSNSTKK